MAVTVRRNEAVRILEEGHARLSDLFSQLSDEDFARRGTIGGGEWSAKDVAAHMGGWYELILEDLSGWRPGLRPGFADLIAPDEIVDRMNAEIVEGWLQIPAPVARQRYGQAHQRLVEAIRGLSDGAWEAEVPARESSVQSQSLGDLRLSAGPSVGYADGVPPLSVRAGAGSPGRGLGR